MAPRPGLRWRLAARVAAACAASLTRTSCPSSSESAGFSDDPVGGLQALQNFERRSEITSDRQLAEMRFVIRVHNHGAQTLRAEEQSVHRHLHSRSRDFYLQVHLSVAAREELGGLVRHIHFRQERSRIGIDGFRGAHHFPLKVAARDIAPARERRPSPLRTDGEYISGTLT